MQQKHLTKYILSWLKTLNKVGRERTYLHIMKTNHTANIILLNRERLKVFPLNSGMRWGWSEYLSIPKILNSLRIGFWPSKCFILGNISSVLEKEGVIYTDLKFRFQVYCSKHSKSIEIVDSIVQILYVGGQQAFQVKDQRKILRFLSHIGSLLLLILLFLALSSPIFCPPSCSFPSPILPPPPPHLLHYPLKVENHS